MSITIGSITGGSGGGGGGGAGGAEVLTADPGSPTEDQQWVLKVEAADPTDLSASVGPTGEIAISITGPTTAKGLTLGGGTQVATFSLTGGGIGEDITPAGQGAGDFSMGYQNGVSDVDAMIIAINIWSNANLGESIATLGFGLGSALIENLYGGDASGETFNNDTVTESFKLKIQGAADTYSMDYVKE